MTASKSTAIPRYTARGSTMSTAEIKARIEAMFSDNPAPKAPHMRRFA